MELGIGLLGTRFMGKAHSHAYKSITTFMGLEVKPRLVAIYGRDPENTRYVASAYGYEKYYLDWRKLIKDPDVEVVDNSLPNFLHKDPCVEALESGKSVICEKPLARSLDEALEMLRAARKSGMVHGIIFNKRWFPAVQLAKKFIDEGLLGKILHFRFAYHQDWGAD
ncbi:MAG: gfo/Idh/MocA family oxidoreductase, partial [Thermoprotei archaeon]